MSEKLKTASLRVDFAGGWLDVPALARPGAFIVNCAITPAVTLESWPYERCAGLGGSAAYALLSGRDSIQEELNRAGWQDPAIVMETGICVWRSGPQPVLEAKYNPDWLSGLMALQWTGCPHDTEILAKKQRDYDLIKQAGSVASHAVRVKNVFDLASAIRLSAIAQVREGMLDVFNLEQNDAMAAKYCGSGWGGYLLYLFVTQAKRDAFVAANVNAKAIEPFIRSVHSSVLLWQ